MRTSQIRAATVVSILVAALTSASAQQTTRLGAKRSPPPAVSAGHQTFDATCASCHGGGGQGVWSTNAPRLAHMSDWYMKRQLQYFQEGLRGSHPQDFNGSQMAVMAKLLDGEQAINDVLDHIDTL